MLKKMSRTMLAAAAVVLLASGNSGCKRASADPFPASGDVAGWQKTDGTRTFAAKDLWQYIDGDAEHFIKAGVETTSTSDYTYQGNLEAVVDVHTMATEQGARTLLETGVTKEAQHPQVGEEAVAYGQSISFRKGKMLVRIVAYESNADTPQALLALAHGVESKL